MLDAEHCHVIRTNYRKAKIVKDNSSPWNRIYKKSDEIISHIVLEGSKLVQSTQLQHIDDWQRDTDF